MSQTADTILAQLGGHKFIVMTGAKHLMGEKDSLTFKLPRGAKDGINCVKIKLEGNDTYTVTFYKQGRAPSFNISVVHERYGIYDASLRPLFTSLTGLETSLGTLCVRS